MNSKQKKIITLVALFFIVTGFSSLAFAKLVPPGGSGLISPRSSGDKDEASSDQDSTTSTSRFTGPKTEECPLNGAYFTKEEKDLWSARRPLLAMIENHEDSRPLSGIQSADIVYEAVAEGGITRLMGAFYCAAAGGAVDKKYDIGPVRSARTYFLDWASEYSDFPLYNHVGGANCSAVSPGGPCTTDRRAQALEQIGKYGWLDSETRSDMNQFALSYKDCRREPERTGQVRATEHTMYCSTQALWETAAKRGLTQKTTETGDNWDEDYRSWLFKDEAKSAEGLTTSISFDFWSGYKAYAVTWTWDKEKNIYLRQNGGEPFLDFNTGNPISVKNVVIQFAKETGPVDEHKHMLYQTIGSGKALIFQDGTAEKGTWSKTSRTSRTIFKDSSGKEIKFNRGQIWIEILPANNEVSYES